MNWLNVDLKKLITAAVVLILPLLSINTQRNPLDQGWYNKPFSFMASLAQSGFFSFSFGVRSTTKLYFDLINIKKESASLKEQNSSLLARLQHLEELQKENQRLSGLLDFREKAKMELIAARIMSKDLISDHSTIRIDKGTLQGLKNGQAVITTEGVVGHIFRPGPTSSSVLLISDRYSVVDGIIARTRARGIVEGVTQGNCVLRYVEKSEDVKKGDLVVTSGLDNIFPKGFPVAVVDSVETKTYSISLKVELRPVVDPDKIEEVFVILNSKNQDMSEQMNVSINR